MENYFLTSLLWLYHAACILFSALCLVMAGLSLVGAIMDTVRYFLKKVAQFRILHLAKFIVAAPAAFLYFYLYHYKGISLSALHADLAKTMILIIVSIAFPLMLLIWVGRYFEPEKAGEQS